ncbi:hypothetical protein VTJ04DRAFT_9465 [Mycothermus thermophilus]|uniref:uncharacterized protein n=1 Tax=Humicola insolens TaxID=85995 RepID=UPI0037421A6E
MGADDPSSVEPSLVIPAWARRAVNAHLRRRSNGYHKNVVGRPVVSGVSVCGVAECWFRKRVVKGEENG